MKYLKENTSYSIETSSIVDEQLVFKVIEVDLVDKCNLSCPHCFRSENNLNNTNKMIDFNKFKKFIETSITDKHLDIKLVRLIGVLSEPTLYPHIIELVEYLNSKNINVQISTNGNIKRDRFWNDLSKALNGSTYNEILFAIEGSTQEMYEKYRVGGKLENVLHNICEISKGKEFKLGVQFIHFNFNDGELDKVKKITSELDVDFFEVFHANDVTTEHLILPNSSIMKDFYLKRQKFLKSTNKYSSDNIICASEHFKELFISIDSKIFPCTNFFESSLCNIDMLDDDAIERIIEITSAKNSQECYNACSKIGHKLETNYLRKRIDNV